MKTTIKFEVPSGKTYLVTPQGVSYNPNDFCLEIMTTFGTYTARIMPISEGYMILNEIFEAEKYNRIVELHQYFTKVVP